MAIAPCEADISGVKIDEPVVAMVWEGLNAVEERPSLLSDWRSVKH